MSWEYPNPEGCVSFDFRASFDEQCSALKSSKGGTFKRGSHNYYVLMALFAGHTIDDYEHRPLGANGKPINNVRTRVAQLKNEWSICIGSRTSTRGNYKEYMIYGRGV